VPWRLAGAFGTYALENIVAFAADAPDAYKIEYTPVATTYLPVSTDLMAKVPYGLDGIELQIGAPEGLFLVAMKCCV
jgi:hypothetical protein